jgi:hypothetical protein
MKKIYILGGLSAALITAAAMAAPGGGLGRAKIDVNGDGNVTKAEVTAHADSRFAVMDADKNGMIDKGDRQARMKARFTEMDADNNGSISEAEFMTASSKKVEQRKSARGEMRMRRSTRNNAKGVNAGDWGRGDTNNDQAISRAEYDAATLARFNSRDKDGNGTLSGEELKGGGKFMRGRRAQNQQQDPS